MKLLQILGLLVFTGCALKQPPPVCRLDVNMRLFPPWQPDAEALAPQMWSSLLLRGADRDCRGQPLLAGPLGAQLSAPQPLMQHDGGDVWLVWLKTHAAPDGTLLGPVARVGVAYEDLKVLALGTLQADAAAMQLRRSVVRGHAVLQAQSGTCTAAACAVTIRLLVEQGGQYLSAPGNTVPLQRFWAEPCGPNCRRTFEFSATCDRSTTEPYSFMVQERLVVREGPGGPSGEPGRVLRQSEVARTLTYVDGQWHASAASLWDRVPGPASSPVPQLGGSRP